MSKFKSCVEACQKLEVSCPNKDCRNWINYEDDMNCSLITVEKNDNMTLRDVAKRLKCSFVRVKQLEESALKKMNIRLGRIT
jgi:predicted Zn-dependent protease